MPEYISKGGSWSLVVPSPPKTEKKEPVEVKLEEVKEIKEVKEVKKVKTKKPVTKSKPKRGRPKGR